MKKIIAMLLALVMVCGLATVAFADTSDGVTASSSTTTIVLNKLYTITGAADISATTETNEANDVYPHETLNFVSTPAQGNPTKQNLTIADLEVAYDATAKTVGGKMAITLPAYTNVGVYKYTVKEIAGNAQAAAYATDEIELQVLVEYNDDHTALEATLYLTDKEAGTTSQVGSQANGKVDTFINTYDVGHLNVKKTVSGNLASTTQYFDFTVVFESEKPVASAINITGGSDDSCTDDLSIETNDWVIDDETDKYTYTHNFKLKADETLSFYNIPAGVTYTVTESDAHNIDDANGTNPSTGYTTTGEVTTGTAITSNTTDTVTINNDKSTSVETGVILDSAPYFVMLAVALFGMVALVSKKRYEA